LLRNWAWSEAQISPNFDDSADSTPIAVDSKFKRRQVIDDSYNGNPDGAAEGDQILAGFREKRKFIITPGLVEMGSRTEEVHTENGKKLSSAAKSCHPH